MHCRMEICVISARKLVIKRGNARSLKNGKRKTPIGNQGVIRETPVVLIPAHQFCAIIVGKRVIYHGKVEENRGIGGGEETADMEADMAKSVAVIQEVLKKLVPEAVFP